MKRTITVTGRGEITLCPDTAKLTMELREEGAEHAAVTDACDDRAELLLTALEKAGIARDLVKVLSMRVEAHYKTTDGTRMLAGYTAEQRLLLLCKSEPGILADVLKAVLSSGASPLLSLDYIVRDPEQYRAQLISLAVEDAAERAAIERLSAGGRAVRRRLQAYSVSLRENEFSELLAQGVLQEESGLWFLTNFGYYDEETGIRSDASCDIVI